MPCDVKTASLATHLKVSSDPHQQTLTEMSLLALQSQPFPLGQHPVETDLGKDRGKADNIKLKLGTGMAVSRWHVLSLLLSSLLFSSFPFLGLSLPFSLCLSLCLSPPSLSFISSLSISVPGLHCPCIVL